MLSTPSALPTNWLISYLLMIIMLNNVYVDFDLLYQYFYQFFYKKIRKVCKFYEYNKFFCNKQNNINF